LPQISTVTKGTGLQATAGIVAGKAFIDFQPGADLL
jgi:hypothetical protein